MGKSWLVSDDLSILFINGWDERGRRFLLMMVG